MGNETWSFRTKGIELEERKGGHVGMKNNQMQAKTQGFRGVRRGRLKHQLTNVGMAGSDGK